MAISLDAINRTVLRTVFLPWFKQTSADYGITLRPDWNPSDDDLARLAERVSRAFGPEEED